MHSTDGRSKIRVGEERRHTPPAPLADGIHKRGDTRQQHAPRETSEEAALDFSSACRRAGEVKTAARAFTQSRARQDTRRRGPHWWLNFRTKTTPPFSQSQLPHCWRALTS